MFRENPAFHIWTKGWHQPQGQGLACSWWGLGPRARPLIARPPRARLAWMGVTAFSHHRPTRGQACTLKVKYTIQNTLNQSIVWSWYFGIMILLHFASSQTKMLHAGRQGPRLSFWCWDEGPLRGSYTETAMLSTCWVNYTLLNLFGQCAQYTEECTDEGRWAEIVVFANPRWKHSQVGSKVPRWKHSRTARWARHQMLKRTRWYLVGWGRLWLNDGMLDKLSACRKILWFHSFTFSYIQSLSSQFPLPDPTKVSALAPKRYLIAPILCIWIDKFRN